MSECRYRWMKLTKSFMESDIVDYLMSMKDGANYVVLYEMLCLKTIDTEGRLYKQNGDTMIPLNVEYIRRECKYFSADTIRVALELFRKLGLVYEDANGMMALDDYAEIVSIVGN